jgi:hypothetical protein
MKHGKRLRAPKGIQGFASLCTNRCIGREGAVARPEQGTDCRQNNSYDHSAISEVPQCVTNCVFIISQSLTLLILRCGTVPILHPIAQAQSFRPARCLHSCDQHQRVVTVLNSNDFHRKVLGAGTLTLFNAGIGTEPVSVAILRVCDTRHHRRHCSD